MAACLRWAGVLFCALAIRSAARADAPPVLIGTFQSHQYAGDCLGGNAFKTTTMPSFQLKLDCSADGFSVGSISGTISIVFPTTTSSAHYDTAGTHLIFDAPLVTHVVTDLLWTPRAEISKNSGQLVVESFDTEGGPGEGDAQCRVDGPVLTPAGGVATSFHGDATCSWASLPIVGAPNSPNPLVYIESVSAFSAKSGSLASPSQEIITFYNFSVPTADLSVDHIEVVQTVQKADNSEPLFSGKSTVVRVFPKLTDTNPSNTSLGGVTALLRGFHGRDELPHSPRSPFNPGDTIAAKLSPNREATNDSLNFLLPPEWTVEGDLSLTAAINPGHTIPETNYGNNSGSLKDPIHFQKLSPFEIGYVPVCYLDLQHCPSNAIATYHAMAQKLFPLADSGLAYSPMKIPRLVYPFLLERAADESSLLAFLQLFFNLIDALGAGPGQLVGWLPPIRSSEIHEGLSDPAFDGGKSRVFFAQDLASSEAGAPADLTLSAYVFAHEAAHNLSLRHTDVAEGGDGCGAIDANSDFALYYTDKKATIHEVGFDAKYKVAIPSTKKDLMTQCTPPDNFWISPYHYERLAQRLLDLGQTVKAGPGIKAPERLATNRAALASDYVLVSGRVRDDGSAGQLGPALRISAVTGSPPSDPSGTHCLLFSSGATTLSRYCFTVTFDTGIRALAGAHLDTASFSVKAPLPAETMKIALTAGTSELASVTRSPNAPKISISSPANGAVWSGTNTLAWTASDADGDPLTFSVLTSADNGADWVPIQTGLTASQYTFDTAELPAGSQTLFKVLATDGFNTTAATVGPVTIAAQPFLEATPALDLGVVASGQSSTLPILLTNRGELAVKVTALTFDNAQFSTDAAVPFSIAPGGSQGVNVSFKPTSAGPKTARLTIVSDDASRSPLTVSLSGAGCVSVGGRPCALPRTTRVLPPR